MCKTCDGLTKQRGSWELLCQTLAWTDIRWVKVWDASSTWQLKEVGYQSSLSGQTKVDESQDLHVGRTGEKSKWFCSPKHEFSPLWMRSLLADGYYSQKKKKKKGCDGWNWTVWPFVIGIETAHQMKWGCQKAKMARIAHQGDIGVMM